MLESPYEWDNIDGGAGTGFVINDWVNRDITNSSGWYQVIQVDGLWDADVRSASANLPGRSGTRSADWFYGGKTVVLSGYVRAKDLATLRTMQRNLAQAFNDLLPHKLFFTPFGGPLVYLTCRKNQKLDMPEVISAANLAWKHTRGFTIQLYADDPNIYNATDGSEYEGF